MMAAVIAAAPWVSNSLAGSRPSGSSRWVGSRSAAVRCQKAFWAEVHPAGSESVATAIRSRPSPMSMLARSSLIWLTVRAVPMGAMPTAAPPLPRVMARASMGPSTMTGSAPLARSSRASAYPKRASRLVKTGVVRVLRYFGPA